MWWWCGVLYSFRVPSIHSFIQLLDVPYCIYHTILDIGGSGCLFCYLGYCIVCCFSNLVFVVYVHRLFFPSQFFFLFSAFIFSFFFSPLLILLFTFWGFVFCSGVTYTTTTAIYLGSCHFRKITLLEVN